MACGHSGAMPTPFVYVRECASSYACVHAGVLVHVVWVFAIRLSK